MLAKFIDSQINPHPVLPSPKLAKTILSEPVRRARKAAPTAMPAEPPTIALFGYAPNGVKKACIEPPIPLLNPTSRIKTSASMPARRNASPGRPPSSPI